MRKYLVIFCLPIVILLFTVLPVSADRSFTIDQVTIDAQIDEEGIMNVFELYTYTFDGSFEGVTRSIGSDIREFRAYLLENNHLDFTDIPSNAEPLSVEKEDQTYKVYSEAHDETKYVLYHYQVYNSVKKYSDIAEITYDFFDHTNKTDISDLSIVYSTPKKTISDRTHVFSRADSGEFLMKENNIHYQNNLLKAGDRTRIHLIFPAEELSGMDLTKEKNMYDKILAEEQEYIDRLENLNQKMNQLMPIVWILIIGLITVGTFVKFIHPNRYRGHKDNDELLQLLEKTDPLMVSYLDKNARFTDHSIIAELFSLRRKGIITFKEVPSLIYEYMNTFRFTWVSDHGEVDLAEGYLREWLFSEEDEHGRYFLLESIIDNPDEPDDVREKKANEFRQHFNKWKGLLEGRAEFQDLIQPFKGYSFISILFITLSFSLFFYLTTIHPISATDQIVLPVIGCSLAFVSAIFSRRKWVFLVYYLFLVIASFIFFTITSTVLLAVLFFGLSLVMLFMIPTFYWEEHIKETKYAMRKAYQLISSSRYPIGKDTLEIERQLEYAIILGTGESFAEQCGEEERFRNLDVENTLLKNPVFVTDTFSINNIAFYSTIYIGADTTSSTFTSSTSSTGGGGAGAF